MDIITLRQIATVLVTIAFFGVCFWVFSLKLKKRFEEDAKLPFADDEALSSKRTNTKDDGKNAR